MNNIKQRKIYKVSEWNRTKSSEGRYMLIYTLGNGSMSDEPRKRGYVVQKYHKESGERSKFFKNYELALSDFYQGKW